MEKIQSHNFYNQNCKIYKLSIYSEQYIYKLKKLIYWHLKYNIELKINIYFTYNLVNSDL